MTNQNKPVGTVLGGEFHYLTCNHGLADGTMLYAKPSPVGQVHGEESCEKIEAELQFYREEAHNLPNILIGAGVFRVDHDGDYKAAWANIMDAIERLAARQPAVVDLPESLHDRVEALREVAARQPVGHVVVTRNENGTIVAVTRQDDEGNILQVIAE